MGPGPRRRWKAGALLAAAAALLGFGAWIAATVGEGPQRIVAPRPPTVADESRRVPLDPSFLSVPVVIRLGTLLGEVEEAVPRRWGSPEEPIEVPGHGRTDAAVTLERAPFQAELIDSTAILSTTVAYTLDATYDLPLLPDLNLACGTDGDARPRLAVALRSPIRLTRDWRLDTEARIHRVVAASSGEEDRCEVTFAGFDVTGRMEAAARRFLEDHLSTIDSIAGAADIRSSFTGWWNVLRAPIELDDRIWLEIRPTGIGRGAIRGRGQVVEVDATLEARPRVLLGERPADWDAPLPSLGPGSADDHLHILIEGRAEYPTASRRLTTALAGSGVEAAGRRIEISDLELSGIGAGRIALQVTVRGDVEGRLFLVGTPSFDPASGQVFVPDLQFSVETANLLVSGASRALHRQLEALLRERARWPVDGVLSWAADRLREGLNRTLADGVVLAGEVGDVKIVGVEARTDALLVRAAGLAEATLTIDRD